MEDINYKTRCSALIQLMESNYETNKAANHATRLVVGTTPQLLLDLGFPQLPLVINGKVIDKAFFDHCIKKSNLINIYGLIAAPKAIYTAPQGNPGSVIVTYEIQQANPVIIPIHPNAQEARGEFFNKIASMYSKAAGNGRSIEARWKDEGLLLWETETSLRKAS